MVIGEKKPLPLTLVPELINPGRILVAVSGGADSVALLHLLHAAAPRHHWKITVAHLHHGIRHLAADADARFVRTLARRLAVPCVVGRAAVPALAKRQGISLEMAAREARYAFLQRVAAKVKANSIALAHTADDQVETVLLKLVRGAGRAGLSGMEARVQLNGIPVVRPLLGMTRADIEAYLKANRIAWREDESNRDLTFLRNRVRHELLPLLERHYNPGVRGALLRTSEILASEDEWMENLARDLLRTLNDDKDGSLVCPGLLEQPLAARRRVILSWLIKNGVPESALNFEGIARLESLGSRRRGSETIELSEGWRVQRRYDRLCVVAPGQSPREVRKAMTPVKLRIPGITRISEAGLRVTVSYARKVVRERGAGPGRLPACCTLSLTVLGNRSLVIRGWRPGDRMEPYGMTGSRKIQDVLVDAKVPRDERPGIPLLVCNGEVVWLPGYRLSRKWVVEEGATRVVRVVLEALPAKFPLSCRGGRDKLEGNRFNKECG